MAGDHRERPLGAGHGSPASMRPTTMTKKMTPRMNCIVDGLPVPALRGLRRPAGETMALVPISFLLHLAKTESEKKRIYLQGQ
jgi:hypothetical protein